MAKFTTGKTVNLRYQGHDLVGTPGTTLRIPDSMRAAFQKDFAERVGGINWLVPDEIEEAKSGGGAGGEHPDLTAHVTLGLSGSVHSHDTTHDHAGVYADPHPHPYAATVHTHAQSQVTNLTNDLASKAATIHTHAQSAVTGLTTALDGKAPVSHSHVDGDLPASIARDTEVTAAIAQHVATATHGGSSSHPDLATHDALGLATDAELAAHAAAANPHPTYLTQAEGDALYADDAHTHPGGGGVDIKSGVVNVGVGASVTVTFNTPFATIPRVVVTLQFSSSDSSTGLSVHSVTTGGFTIRGVSNQAGNVAWIATDAGNP